MSSSKDQHQHHHHPHPSITIICHNQCYIYVEDYIESLKSHTNLTLLLYDDISQLNTLDDSNITICFYFIPELLKLKNLYILNTEQLSRDNYKTTVNSTRARHKLKYIDYSLENISYYNSRENLYYLPYQVNHQEIFNYSKANAVAVVGSMSNYRLDIYNKLSTCLVINNIQGWSKERDEKLFRHKILLNVHYDKTYNIFESFRCFRCLLNKILVVSETCSNQDLLEYKEFIIFANYDNLVEKTVEVFNNYDYY